MRRCQHEMEILLAREEAERNARRCSYFTPSVPCSLHPVQQVFAKHGVHDVYMQLVRAFVTRSHMARAGQLSTQSKGNPLSSTAS